MVCVWIRALCLFATERSGSVWLRSAYMGVSIAKIGTGSQNKHAVRRRSEPLLFSVLLRWGTEPSEMVPKVCLMVHMGQPDLA